MADKKMPTMEELEAHALERGALYRLGEALIRRRLWITLFVVILTGFMAFQASKIQMNTSFNDLLPYRHPFVRVHFRFADQFGGANNINVMIKVDEGDVFTKGMLTKIFTRSKEFLWLLMGSFANF